ncbi:V-type ATPase 116kDa subunit family protein [Candidatus Venteria ishoeyi]|uniref:V-type ATP synthase subunit I n=1 Tax=Candidatus Venteria ishoeyi TaxID=1899563 RepID=UPI0025A4D6F0|nr:V-type ATPase 116kDa subunit family protein [Candidatus Venteria ishoeyi]MDM8546719.1 V-type ATPase 116kDa subunit family protein [Candidatus Venteria ishoeyi]
MFRPAPMQRVSLKLMKKDIPDALFVLLESGLFNPEQADLPTHILPEYPAAPYQKIYRSAQTRFDKIKPYLLRLDTPTDETVQAIQIPFLPSLDKLQAINQHLEKIWRSFSVLEEKRQNWLETQQQIKHLWQLLEIFSDLDIDLSYLKKSGNFLDLHVGSLPLTDLKRFETAVSIESLYFMKTFYRSKDKAYIMLAGPVQTDNKPLKLLSTANFHALELPAEFSERPHKIRMNLMQQNQYQQLQIEALEQEIQKTAQCYQQTLQSYELQLCYAAPYAGIADILRSGAGSLSLLEGWMPRKAVPALQHKLREKLGDCFQLSSRNPTDSEREQVPSLLQHPRIFQASEALIKNFGVPRYGELDPTLIFTVTFTLMFGMMFGDVGHGALLMLAGFYGRRLLKQFSALAISIGLSSLFFGFLYGSVFSNEHLLPALWISPLSNPVLMLVVALFWGITFILLACSLKIYNLLLFKEYKKALFDTQGLNGMLLYLAGINLVYQYFQANLHNQDVLWMALPLSILFIYQWLELKSVDFTERLISVIVESLESLIGFFSNTLSFMRVAAFSLNHAALALAVFTIAQGMESTGYWLAVVLGNLFILVLEGAVVLIQVLRLEYYEGFTRFFSGQGRVFQPLRLKLPAP